MKKLLAMVLAMLMMTMSCVAEEVIGGADGRTGMLLADMVTSDSIYQDAIDAGRRIEMNVTIPELSGIGIGDPGMDAAIADFIKALGLRVVTQGDERDIGLSMSGSDVLTLGWANSGDDTYIRSNLIGGTIVLSPVEVEPIIIRLLDMLVLMGVYPEADAAEFKAQLPVLVESIKGAAGDAADAPKLMDTIRTLNFSAFEPVLPALAARLQVLGEDEIVVPRMCDMPAGGVRLTIDEECFKDLLRALMQFIRDNQILMELMADRQSSMTEEERAAKWAISGELYMLFGVYENEAAYNADNPTIEEIMDKLVAELDDERVLAEDFVTTVYYNDAGEIVYLTSVLPLYVEEWFVSETDPYDFYRRGYTEYLNVVYTRQTVAQGVSHVCSVDWEGEGVTIDVLEQENAWSVRLSDFAAQQTVLTVNAAAEDGVIKGDFYLNEVGVGCFSVYHMADETQLKTEIAFSMWLDEEYLAAHPDENPWRLSIGYTCDYTRDGVEFAGKEIIEVSHNDMKAVVHVDIATSAPEESMIAGAVTRPAELDDSAFANWFVSVYQSLSIWFVNLIRSLPETVLTLLIRLGMFG